MRFALSLSLPFALAAGLAACNQPDAPKVRDSWVRLAAAPGRPAAGYFTIQGGPRDGTLASVASPAVGRIELHETMMMDAGKTGGMAHMTMRPVASVAVPAGGGVRFEPGGKHLMLFDVAPTVNPGDTLPLTFTFADGATLTGDARVIAAGDPPPTL